MLRGGLCRFVEQLLHHLCKWNLLWCWVYCLHQLSGWVILCQWPIHHMPNWLLLNSRSFKLHTMRSRLFLLWGECYRLLFMYQRQLLFSRVFSLLNMPIVLNIE